MTASATPENYTTLTDATKPCLCDRQPAKLAKLAVDLHKHLIQMPVQLEEAAQMRNSLLSDLCREQRPTRFHQNRMVSWLMSTHARPRDTRPFAATVGAARTSLRQTNHFWRAIEVSEWTAHGPCATTVGGSPKELL